MNTSAHGKIYGWLLTIVGIILCFLPLYAEWFTKELVELSNNNDISEGHNSQEDLYSFSTSAIESYSMMHVSPWIPFIGGLVALFGGFLLGRAHITPDS
ncbi:hypothetical protein NT6N_23920 [Oceaniferula spumae]|uniref:PDGLE domain-containing protein n=1 Tax=Oceaniferula spumae TaxID=2979115 RepID=A0AAT9FN64_9BACT